MANMYQTGLQGFANNDFAWDTSTFYMMLVTSTYSHDPDHDDRADVSGEITNSGYSAGGQQLDSLTSALDDTNNRAEFSSANETWSSLGAGDQPDAAIIYYYTGVAANDILICYCPLTTPPAPNGGDYTINCPADGWFYLTA